MVIGTKASATAEAYIKEQKGIDIETDEHRLDGEHYTTEIHEIIATDYLKLCKKHLTKT